MLSIKDRVKAERERQTFIEFARAIGLLLDDGSVESLVPPDPDIRCRVNGEVLEYEIGEIADVSVARSLAESLKTGESTGSSLSHEEPLLELFRSKAQRRYRTRGVPLFLLAYYDKQYPPEDDLSVIPDTIGAIAGQMVSSESYDGVYVYDTWNHRLLWADPPEQRAIGCSPF